ncbi:TIGR03936 family radical SAM-associated protein, partial [bacterium]|nr:TIGR03936 family radical SAM-associated protein [bacterium]
TAAGSEGLPVDDGPERPSALGIVDKGFRILHALQPEEARRFVVSFAKQNEAAFYPLHSISGIFERAFAILGLPVQFTEGFNPLPRMELTQPLALGVESEEDVLAVWLHAEIEIYDEAAFMAAFNRCVPKGIRVWAYRQGRRRIEGKHTIGSHYWGSRYSVVFGSREEFHRAREALQNSAAIDSLGVDEGAVSISVALNDAHGGDRNIVRVLAAALGDEKPLSRCGVARCACLAIDESGSIVALTSVL